MIQQIGPHRVRHGNVMDSAGIEALMAGELADIIYSDPPWGLGNLRYWQTMNKKMTGQDLGQAGSLEAFLDQILSLSARYAKNILLIEYGVRWEEELKGMASAHGLTHVGRCTPIYSSANLPLHLHVFAKQPVALPEGYLQGLNGTKGFETVMRATAPFAVPGGVVLDMCCGMGYSAQMAIRHGMRFRGNELNAARLAKTVKRLTKDAR